MRSVGAGYNYNGHSLPNPWQDLPPPGPSTTTGQEEEIGKPFLAGKPAALSQPSVLEGNALFKLSVKTQAGL